MPPVSLCPTKEFHVDLVNMLHRATNLEVKLRQEDEWAQQIDRLDFLTNMNGDICSELDEELTVSDAGAITKEKEERFRDIQQSRAELEQFLDCLQGYHETPLHDVLSVVDDETVQHYGHQLISWFQNIRGHLIEILGRTSGLLKEKEERKKKRKEDSKFVSDFLDRMTTLQTCMMETNSKLNNVAHRQASTVLKKKRKPKPISRPPDVTEVDSDPPASLQTGTVAADVLYPISETTLGGDFITLLEDTKTNLREFHASQQTYSSKANSLHDQTTKAFHNAPPGYPIIPVRNVEIDAIELEITIRQIVVEEFELLHTHFLSILAEETGKREQEAISNLTKYMAEGNKLVVKLLVSCLECDQIEDASLNKLPSGLDAVAS